MVTTSINNNHTYILIKLNNFEVELCTLGAGIYSIKYDNKYMTQTPLKEDYEFPRTFDGKSIARTANRIKGNKVIINNIEYTLLNNEGENTLHGGIDGVHKHDYEYEIIEDDDYVKVLFNTKSIDGESGYPGNMDIFVKYTINKKEPTIRIDFNAVSDKDTLCAMTNHAYYSLGDNDILNSTLYINTHKYIDTNPVDLIAKGLDDNPYYLEFDKGLVLGKYINLENLLTSKAKGYDHYLLFDKVDETIPQIKLFGSKYHLDIYTDFEGTQIFSDNRQNGKTYLGTDALWRRGIAIEPSSPHHILHYLNKDEEYHKFIEYHFNKNE